MSIAQPAPGVPNANPRRKSAGVVIAIAVVAVGALYLASRGCSGDGDGPVWPELKVNLPDLSQAGSVSGRVLFEGDPPKRQAVSMPDPWCKQHHPEPLLDERVVVENGALRDVLVHVKTGLETFVFDYEKTEARLDQKDCVYVPHVLAVRAFQPVRVTSSDGTTHNVNTSRSAQGFNKTFNGPGEFFIWQPKKPELNIYSTCNIHPWMEAYIHVLPHPYFQVTGPDGAFELKNLPPGTYTLEALHPVLGAVSAEVTVPPGGAATQEFRFRKR